MKDRIYISKNSSNTIASGGSVVIDGITLSLSNINEYDVRTIAEEVEVPVKGVKVAGTELTPDSSDKVDIPKATTTNLGVVQTGGGLGIAVNGSGMLYTDVATTAEIEGKTGSGYKPMVPNQINAIMKSGLGNYNGTAFSTAEQTSAQTTIGINTEQFVFTMADGSESTKNIKVSA